MDPKDLPPSPTPAATKAQVSPPSRTKSQIAMLILSLIILGMSIAGAYLWQRYQSLAGLSASIMSSTLQVLSVSPDGKATGQKVITINFNDAVAPHKVEHYFFLSPYVDGTFTRGNSDKQVIFTPNAVFSPGMTYTVKIGSGLTSNFNRPLRDDYVSSFYTDIADTQVQYVKDNLSGIVLTFAAQKPVAFTIKKGATISTITTTIYKSTEKELLSFLTYKHVTDPNNTYGTDTYIASTITKSPSDIVKTTTSDEAEQQLSVPLTPGIYFVESIDEQKTSHNKAFILVNTFGLTLRQDDQQVVLSAFDLGTNKATNETFSVAFYSLENTPTVITERPLAGLQTYAIPFNTRVDLLLAKHGDERIIVPLKVPQSLADMRVYTDLNQSIKMFLYTDRPIYKPGDILHFRGFIREDQDALYATPSEPKSIKVSIDNNISPVTVQTDSHGIFSGDISIPDTLVGEYPGHSLQAQVLPQKPDQYAQGYASFDVMRYIKPEFGIEANVQQSEYTGDSPLTFTINGSYFDGRAYANQSVSYTLYAMNYYETQKAVYNTNFNLNGQGGMCGGGGFDDWYGEELTKNTINLDSNGKATVTYTVPKDKRITSQKITLVATKKDGSGNEIVSAINTIVHAGAYNIFFIPSADQYKPGEEMIVPLYAETREGQKVTKQSLSYKLTKQVQQQNNNYGPVDVLTGTTTTDENGKAIIKAALPNDQTTNSFNLVVTGTDGNGNSVQNEKWIYVQSQKDIAENGGWNWYNESQTYLKIVSSSNSFVVGDTITLTVRSPKELDALLSLERGRIYSPTMVHLASGDNTVTIPVTSALSPSATVVFSFFADQAYHSEGLALNIPAMHKLLNITVAPDKNAYKPGETAQIKITTRDSNTNPISAQASLSVVDKAIFALKQSATPPIHSSLYYFRPRSTNASSSLTWVGTYNWGGGGGGGGGGGPTKLVDTLFWNPNITTDVHGEATISVPLGNTVTTWRAQTYATTDQTFVGQGSADFIVAP